MKNMQAMKKLSLNTLERYFREQEERWRTVIKEAGIKVE